MPQSNRWSDTDIRWDLMEIINERQPETFEPMANKILPPVNVRTISGNIPKKENGDGARVLDITRGERGAYKRGRNVLSEETFSTRVYGYEEPIDNMEDIEADEVLDLETLNTQIVQETLLINQEKRVADLLFNTATFPNAATDQESATATWSTVSAAIRKDDIWPAARKLKKKTRIKRIQMSLIATEEAVDNILLTDDVRESIKYAGATSVDDISRGTQLRFLAEFFKIKEVIQVDNQYNDKGFDISPEFPDIWSTSFALLAYLTPATEGSQWGAGLGRQPFFGKATQGRPMIVESYSERATDQFVIRAKHRIGEKAFAKYGVLITGI